MGLVILDRDGVINRESADFIKSPDEWLPIDGSLDAIARLNRAGLRVLVATNQSGLARGLFDIEALNRIHEKMHLELAELGGVIEAVFFCPCLPDDDCECYKPQPGMLTAIAERLRVSLDEVPVVGDALRDIEAARSAGARPVLVRTGKGEQTVSAAVGLKNVAVYDDLAAFADAYIAEQAAA